MKSTWIVLPFLALGSCRTPASQTAESTAAATQAKPEIRYYEIAEA